jgi:uncharacterized protein YoxC
VGAFIFELMKRLLCVGVMLASTMLLQADPPSAPAPANNPAAVLAAQAEVARALESQFKEMAQEMDLLKLQNQKLQKRINELVEEINNSNKAREEQSRTVAVLSASLDGVRANVKTLGDKIMEVDRKREADKQTVLEAVRTLEKNQESKMSAGFERMERTVRDLNASMSRSVPTPTTPRREPKEPSAIEGVDKVIPYTVKKGEFLGGIVRDFNNEYKSKGYKSLTSKMVREANPKVNFDNLREGEKIKIPVPPKGQ